MGAQSVQVDGHKSGDEARIQFFFSPEGELGIACSFVSADRFRKTYADTLHEESDSVNIIPIRLGHESLDVTLAGGSD